MRNKQQGNQKQPKIKPERAPARLLQQAGNNPGDATYRLVSAANGPLRKASPRWLLCRRIRRTARGLLSMAGRLVVLCLLGVAISAIGLAVDYTCSYSGCYITPNEYLAVRVCRAMPLVRLVYHGKIPHLHEYLAAGIPTELLRCDPSLNSVRRRPVAGSLAMVMKARAAEEQARWLALSAEQAQRERQAQERARQAEQERQLLAAAQREAAQREQVALAEESALAEITAAMNKPEGERLMTAVPDSERGHAAEYILSHSERVAAIKQDPDTIGYADLPRILAINALNDFFTSSEGAWLRDGLPERGYANPGEYLVAVAVHANTPSNYAENTPDRPGIQPMDNYLQMEPEQAIDQVAEDAIEESVGMFTEPLADFVGSLFGDEVEE